MLKDYISIILRIGVALIFLFNAISYYLNPTLWFNYSVNEYYVILPTSPVIISTIEICLAIMLLFGIYIRISAIVATGFVLGTIITIIIAAFSIHAIILYISLLSMLLAIATIDVHRISIEAFF